MNVRRPNAVRPTPRRRRHRRRRRRRRHCVNGCQAICVRAYITRTWTRAIGKRILARVHPPARHGEVNRPPCLRIIHTGWGLDTVNRCQSFLREDTVHEEPALLPRFFFPAADRLDFRS